MSFVLALFPENVSAWEMLVGLTCILWKTMQILFLSMGLSCLRWTSWEQMESSTSLIKYSSLQNVGIRQCFHLILAYSLHAELAILLPVSAQIERIKKVRTTKTEELLEETGLCEAIKEMDNITVFLPTDEAIEVGTGSWSCLRSVIVLTCGELIVYSSGLLIQLKEE